MLGMSFPNAFLKLSEKPPTSNFHDAITFSTDHKNPHDVWSRLQESHSEVLVKCENFQFAGKGQRLTPVATLQVFIEILFIAV